MKVAKAKLRAFQATILKYHKAHGRHRLPWRENHDPYRVLVSEIMLQQTQVERVIPYFTKWLTVFPDVHTLAKAPLSKVLRMWQGLGYNRRAKMLHETAKKIVKERGGIFPKNPESLEQFPGIGPYTARAVCAFAYNQDVVFIETNIRTVLTHHFFMNKTDIPDKEILALLEEALPRGRSREWHAGLMDYGAQLKRTGVRLNSRAKSYVKQKKFAGSAREARGAVVRALAGGQKTPEALLKVLGVRREAQVRKQIEALVQEGLIEARKGTFRLPR
jgi:A/G-specific adenine glycosylase